MVKLAAVGFGVSTLILAIMLVHAHKASAGAVAAPGNVRPDSRGAQDLAAKQIVLGPKEVAETAKKAELGPLKARARDIHKKQRAA